MEWLDQDLLSIRLMENLDQDILANNHARLISLGFDEEPAFQNAVLQTSLVQATALLNRCHTDDDKVKVCSIFTLLRGGVLANAFVPSDVLLPDWQKFAVALSSAAPRDDPYICLSIQKIQLRPEVSDVLLQSFEKAPIRALSLRNNGASGAAKFAARALETNPALQTLVLSHNRIESDADDVISLAERVVAHPSLAGFHLNECGPIGRNDALMAAIAPSLLNGKVVVRLQGNFIGSHGAMRISDCLASNPAKLELLSLTYNLLSDEDVALIAGALKTNDRLRLLELEGNLITQGGAQALLVPICGDGTLNGLFEANHTCKILLGRLGRDHVLSRFNKHLYYPNLNRKEKLLWLLSPHNDGYTSIRFLDDVPVELMPRVLAFIQDRNGIEAFVNPQGTTMNKVYQLLRQWSLPLLYTSSIGPGPRRSGRIWAKKVMELVGNKTK